jgi:pyruvate dehydrogenase E2 component (dihydrolipoamide acetyltransferase)
MKRASSSEGEAGVAMKPSEAMSQRTIARMPGFRPSGRLPAWRKVALATWSAPSSPAAYGVLDLDCEPVLEWVARARKASGESVSLTHVVGKAAALAIASGPETNGFASGGRLRLRETVDVFFQVAFFDDETRSAQGSEKTTRRDANLAGAKISRADGKSVAAIARELRERAQAIRSRGKDSTVRASKLMGAVPAPLRSALTSFIAFLTFDLGLNLSGLGIPFDPFGSCMVTNVGVFGIEMAWAPLIPYARTPICMTIGAVHRAPTVVGDAIEIHRRVKIGVAFDHRVMDGYHAGVMARSFQHVFAAPDEVLGDPSAAAV